MRLITIIGILFITNVSFGQLCSNPGDLAVGGISVAPSAPIASCGTVTITAVWRNIAFFDLDNDNCHLGTLKILLPPAFLGTTADIMLTASDGGLIGEHQHVRMLSVELI